MRQHITRLTKTGGQFAKGKYAIAICQRSGLKKPYSEMIFEPGTNYWVHRSEDDGEDSLVTHPQNYPPEKLTERVALRWAFLDVQLSVPAPVCIADIDKNGLYPTSAGAVSIGSGTCVTTSIGLGVSGGLIFSSPANSQYYIVVFQGI